MIVFKMSSMKILNLKTKITISFLFIFLQLYPQILGLNFLMEKRSSLAEKFSQKISKCDICFMDYNRYEKQPVIICSMHHTICKECLQSLQIKPQCPYCREKINFQKVVVNNYINQLLPNEPPKQNLRVEVLNPPPIRPIPPANSINQLQLQRVYDDDYVNPHHYQYENNEYQQQPDEQFDRHNCWDSIKKRLRIINYGRSERSMLYFVIFIAQIPFLITDLYISFQSRDSECLDQPYINRAYVLRPWLTAMGFTVASLIFILLLGAILRILQCISFQSLKRIEIVVLFLFIIKILLWCYMQLSLFFAVIKDHCNGGIYAYGIILTILHFIFAAFVCLASFCRN